MSEPSDNAVSEATLKREKEKTRDEIQAIQQYLLHSGHMLTREQLVKYLRRVAASIHADLIIEIETLKQ